MFTDLVSDLDGATGLHAGCSIEHVQAQKNLILCAMAPSGETFIVRDADAAWLVPPQGAGTIQSVTETDIRDAIANHGWLHVEGKFATWTDLDAIRQELVQHQSADTPRDISALDKEDVQRIIAIVVAWKEVGPTVSGRRALRRLLDETMVVKEDVELLGIVTGLLHEINHPESRSRKENEDLTA